MQYLYGDIVFVHSYC